MAPKRKGSRAAKRKDTAGSGAARKKRHIIETNMTLKGEELVDLNCEIWWDGEQAFYEGVVKDYDVKKEAYEVHYDDGDQDLGLRFLDYSILQHTDADTIVVRVRKSESLDPLLYRTNPENVGEVNAVKDLKAAGLEAEAPASKDAGQSMPASTRCTKESVSAAFAALDTLSPGEAQEHQGEAAAEPSAPEDGPSTSLQRHAGAAMAGGLRSPDVLAAERPSALWPSPGEAEPASPRAWLRSPSTSHSMRDAGPLSPDLSSRPARPASPAQSRSRSAAAGEARDTAKLPAGEMPAAVEAAAKHLEQKQTVMSKADASSFEALIAAARERRAAVAKLPEAPSSLRPAEPPASAAAVSPSNSVPLRQPAPGRARPTASRTLAKNGKPSLLSLMEGRGTVSLLPPPDGPAVPAGEALMLKGSLPWWPWPSLCPPTPPQIPPFDEAARQGRGADGAVLDSRMAHEIQDRLAAARLGLGLRGGYESNGRSRGRSPEAGRSCREEQDQDSKRKREDLYVRPERGSQERFVRARGDAGERERPVRHDRSGDRLRDTMSNRERYAQPAKERCQVKYLSHPDCSQRHHRPRSYSRDPVAVERGHEKQQQWPRGENPASPKDSEKRSRGGSRDASRDRAYHRSRLGRDTTEPLSPEPAGLIPPKSRFKDGRVFSCSPEEAALCTEQGVVGSASPADITDVTPQTAIFLSVLGDGGSEVRGIFCGDPARDEPRLFDGPFKYQVAIRAWREAPPLPGVGVRWLEPLNGVLDADAVMRLCVASDEHARVLSATLPP